MTSKSYISEDSEILQRLGIIGSKPKPKSSGFEEVNIIDEESPEPSLNPMVTASEGESSENEDDVLYEQDEDTLLRYPEGRKGSFWRVRNVMPAKESKRTLFCRGLLVCTAFFTVGLCLAIIGPTLPDLQSKTSVKSFSSIVSVVSANGFGGLIGVGFGGACYTYLSPFCMMALVLFACAVTTVVIPWCQTLTGVTFVCFIQGICLGILERGGYSMFYAYWRKNYRILQLFYFSLALGACIAPLVTTPFVFNRWKNHTGQVDVVHNRTRREAIEFFDNETSATFDMNITSPDMFTTGVPQKPMVAVGEESGSKVADGVLKKEADEDAKKVIAQIPSTTHSPSTTTDSHKLFPPASGLAPENDTSTSIPTSTSTSSSTSSSTSTTTTTTTTTTSTSTPLPLSVTFTTTPYLPNTTVVSPPIKYHKLLWDKVLIEVKTFNRVQFAYLVVSLLSAVSTFGFALMCCCMPCRALQKPPYQTDFKFHPGKLCASRENRSVTALALLFSFLLVGIESTASTLFTSYLIKSQLTDQAQGVLLTTVFWLAIATSRLAMALFKKCAFSGRTLVVSLSLATLVAAVSAVFSPTSRILLWLATAAFGLTLGPVFPVAYCWLDCKLQLSPWFSSLWLISAEFGRISMPAFTVLLMQYNGDRMLVLMLLVLTLGCSVLYIFLNKAAKAASHLLAVDQLSKQIRGENGEATQYRRIHENSAELETDNLDLDLFDGDDMVHFDKSTEQLVNGEGGIFAQYKKGQKRSIR